MKPGPRDKKYKILITGQELEELKKFTWSMVEAFGLDSRIDKYQGKRQIGFCSWDLDCLEDVISMAIDDDKEYPDKSGQGYKAMMNLYNRIRQMRKLAYE